MRYPTLPLAAIAHLALEALALPRPVSAPYSVVPVNGAGDLATTIQHTVTVALPEPELTVSAVVDEISTTTALTAEHTTVHNSPTIKAKMRPAPPLPPQDLAVGPGPEIVSEKTATMLFTTTHLSTAATTVTALDEATTTVYSRVTPSTSYFDDGMWHTSYGVPVYPSVPVSVYPSVPVPVYPSVAAPVYPSVAQWNCTSSNVVPPLSTGS